MPSRILRLWNASTAAWEEVGDSRLSTHLAAGDPHAQYVLETLADAKGDLLAASAADVLGRLAAGTDGQVLTADSSQALGLRWATTSAGGAYVDEAGDTVTGTLAFSGAAVDSGGAITVTSPASVLAEARVYGSGSAAYAPSDVLGGNTEYGTRFSSAASRSLLAVRWYRSTTNPGITPTAARLWDTTATGSPVWTYSGTPPGWEVTTVGWKEYRLPAGTGPTLVAGRQYVVSYTAGSGGNFFAQVGYTPVPDSGLTFSAHVSGAAGTYPAGAPGAAIGADGGFGSGAASPAPAASGAIRLPTGSAGQVAWRNAGNTADLALMVDATNALTFGGSPLQTQTTADARYLQLAGGTLTGALVEQGATATANVQQAKLAADTQPRFRLDASGKQEWGPGGATAPDTTLYRAGANALRTDGTLGVGVTPAAWGSAWRATQIGGNGVLFADVSGGTLFLGTNTYNDGTTNRALSNAGAARLDFGTAAIAFGTAPSVAAGAAQTFATRLQVDGNGTTTLTPDAATPALLYPGRLRLDPQASADVVLNAVGAAGKVYANTTALTPFGDNAASSGLSTNRWTTVYAVAGTISTSLAEAKTAITPLDPEQALAAVRATTPVTFDYKPPEHTAEWYDLPDDPEEAAAVLEQRYRAAPLEEGARHQRGVVLNSPEFPCDPMFECGASQTSASNGVGVLLAALKSIDARLTALGG